MGYIGRLKPKRLKLHTQATSTSVPPPTWTILEEEQRRESINQQKPTTGHEIPVARPNQVPGWQEVQVQEESVAERGVAQEKRKRRGRKRRRPVPTPLASSSQELKAKILKANGNYRIVFDDLEHIYQLSREETRHTVGQLKRLLREAWESNSLERAEAQLDLFHDWKNHFKFLKQTISLASAKLSFKLSARLPNADFWMTVSKQGLETMRDTWHRSSQEKRESLWPRVVMAAFQSHLNWVPVSFLSTFQSTSCPSYIVEDSVYLLFRMLDDDKIAKGNHQQLVELVMFLLENCPPGYMVLEQMVIRRVMSLISTRQLLGLHEALEKIEHPLSSNTLLHFASRYAHTTKYKVQAAEVIHSLASRLGFDINSPAAASVCTSLLTIYDKERLPSGHAAPDELFKLLLDSGFRPNLLNLSALMQNFCARGHIETAWSIFDLLIRRGIEPDINVFSILLNGSKLTLDMAYFERMFHIIESRGAWTLYLVNDLLDWIYRYNESQKEHRRRQRKHIEALRLMARVYTKFFRVEQLQKLTLFPLENLLLPRRGGRPKMHMLELAELADTLVQRPDALLMKPDTTTLSIMFRAIFRVLKAPMPIRLYYRHFMRLLYQRDHTLVKLIKEKGTLVHDTFLRDILQFSRALNNGVQMVEKMQANAKKEREESGENIIHPPPSVHTYTVLMNGLKNHKRTQAVVTVLNMMIKEGLTPNVVTWNIVIRALIQDGYLVHAVRVVRFLEHIGIESHSRTIYEFNRLNGAKRKRVATLIQALRKETINFNEPRQFAEYLLSIWEADGSEQPFTQKRYQAPTSPSIKEEVQKIRTGTTNDTNEELPKLKPRSISEAEQKIVQESLKEPLGIASATGSEHEPGTNQEEQKAPLALACNPKEELPKPKFGLTDQFRPPAPLESTPLGLKAQPPKKMPIGKMPVLDRELSKLKTDAEKSGGQSKQTAAFRAPDPNATPIGLKRDTSKKPLGIALGEKPELPPNPILAIPKPIGLSRAPDKVVLPWVRKGGTGIGG